MGREMPTVDTTCDLIQNGDEHIETVGEGAIPLGTAGYIKVEGHPHHKANLKLG